LKKARRWELCRGAGDRYDRQRSWEALHLLHLDTFGQDLDPANVSEVELETSVYEAEVISRMFRLPRVTPAFVKYTLACPCEPGRFGRCFCWSRGVCSQGREIQTEDYEVVESLSPR
jgi:hypothetical protein